MTLFEEYRIYGLVALLESDEMKERSDAAIQRTHATILKTFNNDLNAIENYLKTLKTMENKDIKAHHNKEQKDKLQHVKKVVDKIIAIENKKHSGTTLNLADVTKRIKELEEKMQ